MKKYYVYYLLNPANNQPFYVGKGTNHPGYSKRWVSHIREAEKWKEGDRSGNTKKIRTIKDIIDNGETVIPAIVFETEHEEEAFEVEQQHISTIGRLIDGRGPLTNLFESGSGNRDYTDRKRELKSNRNIGKNNPMYGKKHSDKSKQKMSDTKQSRLISGETVPTKHTQQHKDRLSKERRLGDLTKKAVCQIDSSTGLIIHTFESTNQAGQVLNISSWRNISTSCNIHKNRLVGKFYWRWKDDEDITTGILQDVHLLNLKRVGKPVVQLDKNKNILKQWNCIKDISSEFNRAPSTITKWLKVDRIFNGFYWEYG